MKIAVYCSSSNHIADEYKLQGYKLGQWIGESANSLIFGGATGGLMTSVSEGAASKNAEIVGIIPQAVIKMNRQSPLCSTLVSVNTMSERKSQMKEIADIFVVLPGSYGTLDEMFDVVASGVVGEHKKPLIVVNQNNFYSDLLKQVDKMIQEKFIPVEMYKPYVVENIENCISILKSFC